MNYPTFFDSKNSLNLFGLREKFNFLRNLYEKEKLPKIFLLSGESGLGKSTLVNHFLFSIFDNSYDTQNNIISHSSNILNQFKNDIFPNIIYLNGSDYKSVKVDDIRSLKRRIYQSTISNKKRFIILNDIELFNMNSLNALLKIIEEPTTNNYFFLIYNKSKPLLDTIKSRSIELKIFLDENQRLDIIRNLISHLNIQLYLDLETPCLSPGKFIKYNHK